MTRRLFSIDRSAEPSTGGVISVVVKRTRGRTIGVRVSPDEEARLQEAADRKGVSVSRYLRDEALNAAHYQEMAARVEATS